MYFETDIGVDWGSFWPWRGHNATTSAFGVDGRYGIKCPPPTAPWHRGVDWGLSCCLKSSRGVAASPSTAGGGAGTAFADRGVAARGVATPPPRGVGGSLGGGERCRAGGGGGAGGASVEPEKLLAKLMERKSEKPDPEPEPLVVLGTPSGSSSPSEGTPASAAAKLVAKGGRPTTPTQSARAASSCVKESPLETRGRWLLPVAPTCREGSASVQMVRSEVRLTEGPAMGPVGPIVGACNISTQRGGSGFAEIQAPATEGGGPRKGRIGPTDFGRPGSPPEAPPPDAPPRATCALLARSVAPCADPAPLPPTPRQATVKPAQDMSCAMPSSDRTLCDCTDGNTKQCWNRASWMSQRADGQCGKRRRLLCGDSGGGTAAPGAAGGLATDAVTGAAGWQGGREGGASPPASLSSKDPTKRKSEPFIMWCSAQLEPPKLPMLAAEGLKLSCVGRFGLKRTGEALAKAVAAGLARPVEGEGEGDPAKRPKPALPATLPPPPRAGGEAARPSSQAAPPTIHSLKPPRFPEPGFLLALGVLHAGPGCRGVPAPGGGELWAPRPTHTPLPLVAPKGVSCAKGRCSICRFRGDSDNEPRADSEGEAGVGEQRKLPSREALRSAPGAPAEAAADGPVRPEAAGGGKN